MSEVQNDGTPQATEQLLPACTMQDPMTPSPTSVQPCWYVVSDPTGCSTTPSMLTLKTLPAMMDLPAGTSTDISCATSPQGGSN